MCPAKPLEFDIRADGIFDTRPKNGKNGNVNHPSQHCRSGDTELVRVVSV
jgi:hypothetical protein